MKLKLTFLSLLALSLSATAQFAITAIDTSYSSAASSFTYTVGSKTYNWGVSPYDSVLTLNGFTANGMNFMYSPTVTGNVKLRRVDNVKITGNHTVEWVQYFNDTLTNSYNFFAPYQNSMDTFLNNHVFNKGTDNLFDNVSTNSNNVERLDWLLNSAYSTATPDLAGFAVFDKVATTGPFDPFVIAAITAVDPITGDPTAYGTIVRINNDEYGKTGPTITYRVVKNPYPTNLITTSVGTQSLGGSFISLTSLGIAAGTPVYGYSLFADDLPGTATSADLVNFNNATFFPTATGATAGGLDMAAVTGIYTSSSVLPVSFVSFDAVENNDVVNLKWAVENNTSTQSYEVERSENGIDFTTIAKLNSEGTASANYTYADNISGVTSNQLYYRLKQYQPDGSFRLSRTIPIRRDGKPISFSIFPNPVKANLSLNIAGTSNEKLLVNIFNAVGARVLTTQKQIGNGNNAITIDGVNKLPKGIYQLSVKWANSGRTMVKQFSKE